MNVSEVHTHADWLVAVGEAVTATDEMALYELRAKAEGWLQPTHETEAQTGLIDAVLGLIGNLTY